MSESRALGRVLESVASVHDAGIRYFNGHQRPGEPPLVRGSLPFLGNAVSFGRNMLAFLRRCRREHGDVFTIFVAGRRMTFVCDPHSYLAVIRSNALQFEPFTAQVMERAFDFPRMHEEVDMEGVNALARRRLKGEELRALSEGMCAQVCRLLDGDVRLSGSTGEFGLYRLIWDTVFAAGTRVIFGEDLLERDSSRAFEDLERNFGLLVAGLPKVVTRKGRFALRSLAATFSDIGIEPSEWMRDQHQLVASLPPSKRGRTMVAALWALHANTIPSTFWTLAHLLSNEAAMSAVLGELEHVLGGSALTSLSIDQLNRLRLVDSVSREALRLSSGTLIARKAVEAVRLETDTGSWSIREGDEVFLAPQLIHHDPEFFERPDDFVFDRFVEGDASCPRSELGGKPTTAFAFTPFGVGRHTCPGRFFAVNEIKIMVVSLLTRLSFRPVSAPLPGFQRNRAGLGVLPPDRDIVVRWSRRS